jgi:hypothetical protein
MALFYVTGLSGTGKSAVRGELQARGYYARGVDEDGYADWVNRVSGTPDAFPRDDPDFDFHAWYRAHEWVLSEKLRLHDGYEAAYRRFGAVIIDAARPLGDVVDEILAAAVLC